MDFRVKEYLEATKRYRDHKGYNFRYESLEESLKGITPEKYHQEHFNDGPKGKENVPFINIGEVNG